jgi:hypothetical protein
VELRNAAGWLGLLHQGTIATHYSQRRGRHGSPFLPLCHTGWIDVANKKALSPLKVSEASAHYPGCGLHMAASVFLYSINREVSNCSLALFVFNDFEWKLPFPTTDLEAHPAPSPLMVSGGYHDRRSCSGSLCHNCCQLLFHRTVTDASSSRTSPPAK